MRKEDKVIQIGNHVEPKGFANPQCGRVYSALGVAPTVNTYGGVSTGNRRYSSAKAAAEVTAADGYSGSRLATARRRTR